MKEGEKNLLYYGDNLDILRRYVKDETVDLVYLDPPFNSNTNYNVLFAEKDGSKSHESDSGFFGHLDLESRKRIHLCRDSDGGREGLRLPTSVPDLPR